MLATVFCKISNNPNHLDLGQILSKWECPERICKGIQSCQFHESSHDSTWETATVTEFSIFYQLMWLCMKVTWTGVHQEALPYTSNVPAFKTVMMIVSKNMQMPCKIFHQALSLWPWAKATQTDMVLIKAFPQSTCVSSFMTTVFIAAEKMAMFEVFKIFYQPPCPWPWVKVTDTGMVWKALPQWTINPSLKTVVIIVSE